MCRGAGVGCIGCAAFVSTAHLGCMAPKGIWEGGKLVDYVVAPLGTYYVVLYGALVQMLRH
ncbi:hypothetical protein COO60DRAFT_1552268 [Scenedesmus sp. NREL 46B-D3]|nr:hypothetical protein COO60DRAFT_1552268 [Scenedesmus sp. NREL 46B-D3]